MMLDLFQILVCSALKYTAKRNRVSVKVFGKPVTKAVLGMERMECMLSWLSLLPCSEI